MNCLSSFTLRVIEMLVFVKFKTPTDCSEMFVIVKFGKDERRIFNPDCCVDNLLHCIKEECNIQPEGMPSST